MWGMSDSKDNLSHSKFNSIEVNFKSILGNRSPRYNSNDLLSKNPSLTIKIQESPRLL